MNKEFLPQTLKMARLCFLFRTKIWLFVSIIFMSGAILGGTSTSVIAQTPAQMLLPVTRLIIDKINLDTPIVEMGWQPVVRNGKSTNVWVIPDNVAGWHKDSKLPGQGSNTVISGYNNSHGEVFRHLNNLEVSDPITLYVGDQPRQYTVVGKFLLKDKGEPEEVRRANARWIGPINEERLTLVSAWPYVNSSHKIIVVAWPLETEEAAKDRIKTIEDIELVEETPPSLADNPLVAEVQAPTVTQEGTTSAPVASELPSITRITAPKIGLNSAVVGVGWQQRIQSDGAAKNVWEVANYAAGWHKNSKLPGQGGNIVLSGHHNIQGKVFRYLEGLTPGDTVTLYQDSQPAHYAVVDRFIVREQDEPEAVRHANARWIGPINEERLTMVTCWPYETNTHRLIVVAKPVPPPPPPIEVDPLLVEERTTSASQVTPVKDLAVPAAIFPPTPFLSPANSPLTRIVAQNISLDASVTEMNWQVITTTNASVRVWDIPDVGTGWHKDSVLPGQGGNVVLSGHHNSGNEVFRAIVDLQQGDTITLYAGEQLYRYAVADTLILKNEGEPAAVRRDNARWTGPINEERLTLVTGWPYDNNTHKVIVIARPLLDDTTN